jgi:hypothetical protein
VATLAQLVIALKGELLDVMIASPRVRASQELLQELSKNHFLSGAQSARVQALFAGQPQPDQMHEEPALASGAETPPQAVPEPPAPPPAAAHDDTALDPDSEGAVLAFFKEHAAEIAATPNHPFQPLGGNPEDAPAQEEPKAAAAAASASAKAPQASPSPKPFAHKLVTPEDEKRGSVLQKIAKLDIKGRIHLAMRGSKEERSILVRDGTKIVALAVLDSPKVSDGEVEKFASQRNVLEAVLRAIPMKRRFAKNYAVVRNLVFNPRTPLDISLGLMKNLLVADLRNLSGNKEVADTVRKLALRMFKQKTEPAHKG